MLCAHVVRLGSILGLYFVFAKGLEDDEVVVNMTAVEDRSVSLPCNVTFPAGDYAISLVLWFRGNSGIPIYSLDARNGSIYKAFHFTDDILGTRAYFDLTSRPPLLKIAPVKKKDEGVYECRVDYRRARTEKWRADVRVIVPPKNAVIKDAQGKRVKGLIGPFNDGDMLALSCEAEGDPIPNVTWWKDSTLLDGDYSVTPGGIVRNELLIKRLHRDHLMSVLTCQASNTNLSVPVFKSVTLDINLKPLEVRISTVTRPLLAGQQVELVCQSSGSRPPARILWWKGSEKMSNISYTRHDNVTISKLTFTPTIQDHEKYLSCKADNPVVSNSALEDGWIITVYHLPMLRLSLGANIQHDSIREGSDVYFDCNIQANPWVSEVGWRFEGKTLFSDTKKGIIISNQTLVLQKVTRERRGRYQCVATNVVGEAESEEIILRVHYAPVCKSGQKTVFGVDRLESVNIRCKTLADPTNLTFYWSLNNTFERIELHSFITNGTVSKITYRPRTRYGYGVLNCWARNKIGIQKEPCHFSIIPAGRPEPVRECDVLNSTMTTIEIECEAGYNGGLQQNFHLDVFNYPLETLEANLTNHNKPSFSVNDLPPGTTFIFAIYALNSKGKSHSVALTASTLPTPEKRTAKIERPGISPVLGILIGIVGALVLLAILTVAIMKYKHHQENKGPGEQDIINKHHTPFQKDMDEGPDSDTREPDVIPALAVDSQDKNGGIEKGADSCQSSHNGKGRPRDFSVPQSKVFGTPTVSVSEDTQGMSYSEVSGTAPQASNAVRPTNSPTEYDFYRKARSLMFQADQEDECNVTAETPLMEPMSYMPERHGVNSVINQRSKVSTSV
ncbi:protein turtle-like isoform X2 [Tachypleus tridentatus]|uniref:protein turtle-like isoform X2 n=1 Tax=Tachypleus tridentatus TaxID=6853 RepID=UPI003FD00051